MLTRAITFRGKLGTVDPAKEELALCRRIAAGEQHLFARIVDEHGGLVAAVIAGRGVPPSDVEDVAQQVFISAYKALGGFRGEARLSSWLYRIAANAANSHLKRGSLRPRVESVEAAEEDGRVREDSRGEAGAAWVGSRALSGAMRRLPANQRTALALYYFEELSYEEISVAMRMKINTVRTQIRRGKQRLAGLLDVAVLEL
jgi:RNA polymerase sigma-70 factor, ECF subfamily